MRHLISAVVVAVAVVLQLAVADRIVFPGGANPDLVLLTVAALALATGPMAGSIAGFCAGLALDIAPPAGHLVGQDALVFCLVGYACGLAADSPSADGIADQERSALFELAVTAVGAVCGEAMIAGLGVMLSDPRVTWAAIKHVLPVAVGYDVLLSPFVLLAVAAMLRVAGSRAAEPGFNMSAASQRRAAWAASTAAAGAVRQLSGSGSPRLHLSGQGRHGGSGSSGGLGSRSGPGRQGPGLGPGRREPHLKLRRSGSSGGRLGSAGGRLGSATGRAGSGAGGGRPAVRRSGSGPKFGARRGEGVLGGSLLGGSGSLLSGSIFGGRSVFGSGSGLGGGSGSGGRLAGSRLGGSLLGGSVFSGSRSGLGRGSGAGRGSGIGGGSGIRKPGGARIRIRGTRSGPGKTHPGAGPHAPRFRKTPVVSRLARGLSRPGQRRSPGRGWLRGTGPSAPRRSSLAGSGSASRGLFRRKRPLGRSAMGRSALGGGGLGGGGLGGGGLGLRRSGPARLRIGRQKTMRKPMKRRRNWRGSGGFR
jgi:rod shape-determining protein MreD